MEVNRLAGEEPTEVTIIVDLVQKAVWRQHNNGSIHVYQTIREPVCIYCKGRTSEYWDSLSSSSFSCYKCFDFTSKNWWGHKSHKGGPADRYKPFFSFQPRVLYPYGEKSAGRRRTGPRLYYA